MSEKPGDIRPKIISFPTAILDGLRIAARQDVLWPCHAFSISIPQKRRSNLNVLEETVLRMTEVESGDTENMAQILCLSSELVAFIQNRLNHLGLLTSRYALSEAGRQFLDEWQNEPDKNPAYTVATVFVDLLSGKLLPYVSTKPLRYKTIIEEDRTNVKFLIHPTDERPIFARRIGIEKNAFWKTVPDANDIVRAIRKYEKNYPRYVLLSRSADQYPPQVPRAEAISLQESPELVYLHCEALIQKGNFDLLVTDGCGLGFSEAFANYLNARNWHWVTDMKGKGRIDKLGSAPGNEDADDESLTADWMKKYPQLSKPLKRAQEDLSKAEGIDVDSSNSRQEFIQRSGDAVRGLYESIEWALRFVVSDNPVSYWENLFSQSYQENGKVLCLYAAEIGFDVAGSVKSLLQVKYGKIKAVVEQGDVEIQPLLALAIAGAKNSSSHPLRHLAIEDAGCLSFINTLKEVRDPIAHGNATAIDLSRETLGVFYGRTIRLIQLLIPDIEISHSNRTKRDRDIDQDRLSARIELEKEFGLAFIQTVSLPLREELIKVMMLSQHPNPDTHHLLGCITSLASIMQLLLFEVVKTRPCLINDQTNLIGEAIEKIVQSGFYRTPDAVPEQIRTVNIDRLRRTVRGSSTTLGAHLLAVFLSGAESELTRLREQAPKFIDFIADLIRLRGHGNKLQPDFSRDDMDSLKDKVFSAIKMITGIFL